MAEEKTPFPFAEMIALWQKMVWEGFEMMLKAPAFAIGLGKAFEHSTAFQEQVQQGIQAGLQAMHLPTAEDLRRIAEGLSAVQAQVEAVKSYLAAVEVSVKLQEAWRKEMDATLRRLLAYHEEGQKTFQAWTRQVEDRFRDLQRFWEEGAKRWEEGVQQAVALTQTSQRSLEELHKNMWEISRRILGLA